MYVCKYHTPFETQAHRAHSPYCVLSMRSSLGTSVCRLSEQDGVTCGAAICTSAAPTTEVPCTCCASCHRSVSDIIVFAIRVLVDCSSTPNTCELAEASENRVYFKVDSGSNRTPSQRASPCGVGPECTTSNRAASFPRGHSAFPQFLGYEAVVVLAGHFEKEFLNCMHHARMRSLSYRLLRVWESFRNLHTSRCHVMHV
jgi:hypothetical protein